MNQTAPVKHSRETGPGTSSSRNLCQGVSSEHEDDVARSQVQGPVGSMWEWGAGWVDLEASIELRDDESLNPWFSSGSCFASYGTFENVQKHFWLSQLGERCYWPGMAAKHPTMHRRALTAKDFLAQSVSSAEAEKPWSDIYPSCSLCLRNARGPGSGDSGLLHQALFLRKASCGDLQSFFFLFSKNKITERQSPESTPSF